MGESKRFKARCVINNLKFYTCDTHVKLVHAFVLDGKMMFENRVYMTVESIDLMLV